MQHETKPTQIKCTRFFKSVPSTSIRHAGASAGKHPPVEGCSHCDLQLGWCVCGHLKSATSPTTKSLFSPIISWVWSQSGWTGTDLLSLCRFNKNVFSDFSNSCCCRTAPVPVSFMVIVAFVALPQLFGLWKWSARAFSPVLLPGFLCLHNCEN